MRITHIMPRTMRIGPKGQVVIPREIREKVGMLEGTEVVVEMEDGRVVVKRRAPPTRAYVDYFVTTFASKLRKEIEIKKIQEERIERTD